LKVEAEEAPRIVERREDSRRKRKEKEERDKEKDPFLKSN
jgi:hypothetical protein